MAGIVAVYFSYRQAGLGRIRIQIFGFYLFFKNFLCTYLKIQLANPKQKKSKKILFESGFFFLFIGGFCPTLTTGDKDSLNVGNSEKYGLCEKVAYTYSASSPIFFIVKKVPPTHTHTHTTNDGGENAAINTFHFRICLYTSLK